MVHVSCDAGSAAVARRTPFITCAFGNVIVSEPEYPPAFHPVPMSPSIDLSGVLVCQEADALAVVPIGIPIPPRPASDVEQPASNASIPESLGPASPESTT